MRLNIKNSVAGVLIAFTCISTVSCKKMFDFAPEDALELDQAYRNVYDADAAVIGIYGKLMNISDRYMILNELRADLEETTPLAGKYLTEINNHSTTENNPWADPKPFYEIIMNCNDALHNFDLMLRDKRMVQADYNIRYSEVGAVRSWLYLQLGIHFGTVPYITDPLATIQDVQDESKFPRIPFDQLITNLVQFTEALPNKDPMPAGTSLVTTMDSYSTTKMFVNKYLLLGDLNLWQGNWSEAAKYYHKMMNYSLVLYPAANSENYYNTYTLGNNPTRIDNGNWISIFTAAYAERYSNYEIIWHLPFDKKFSPSNPLVKLYSSGDNYKVKPSALAISKWKEQTRNDGTPYDTYRGEGYSYRMMGGNALIYKLVPNYSQSNPFETDGKWVLYRASMLHLRMAETANRDGRDKLAYALMNVGLRATYSPRSVPGNVTNIMQSFDENPSYYFDARFGNSPTFRAQFAYNQGVRGRVSLSAVTVDSTRYFDMSVPGSETKAVVDRKGLTLEMENLIINEAGLELAFEGNRWQDLLRVALRREKESPGTGKSFLYNKISAKFTAAGLPVPAGVSKLATDVNSWYLPFRWK
ncbi:MAG: RagB/SusD family nutrient uptake outer membrane protein [Arcticibacter sp.]